MIPQDQRSKIGQVRYSLRSDENESDCTGMSDDVM